MGVWDRALAVAWLAGLATLGGCGDAQPSRPGTALLEAALDGAFVASEHTVRGGWVLEGSDGPPLDVTDLLGAWSIVGVGYTTCPDVCPATLTAMPQLVDRVAGRLPEGSELQVVFVAVDPERDREGLEPYRAHFGAGWSAPLRAATGSPDMLRSAADDLGLAFVVDGTDVQHSTAWALIAPSGRIEGYLLHPTDPDRCVEGADAALGKPGEGWASAPPIQVDEAWLRPPAPGGHVAAAYGRIRNDSDRPRKLVSASRPDGTPVAVHETYVENGIAGMRPAVIDVPARGEARLEPMGAHLMIDQVSERSYVDVRLGFDDGTAAWSRFAARP